ncbi:hypothetical protein H5410_056489 [Solanum commersonii]|uniref:Uncharacterized protein n=1 Tax=Solanum commersonii TaxID=4109 RepID=A0A9J5WKE7_SOLCO|nr:hypothetical protein H5410_056489 [Solanum commersonii]
MVYFSNRDQSAPYLKRPQKISTKITLEIRITKRSMDYSRQKLVKWVVYQLRGLFHLENGLKFGSPKDPWTIAHENQQNDWLISFGDHFTLKMGRFSYRDQLTQ